MSPVAGRASAVNASSITGKWVSYLLASFLTMLKGPMTAPWKDLSKYMRREEDGGDTWKSEIRAGFTSELPYGKSSS